MSAQSATALDGWQGHDPGPALTAYLRTRPEGWPLPAAGESARQFFGRHFEPAEGHPALLTGYYEPEVPGSLQPSPDFPAPLHGVPPDWDGSGLWHSRAEIVAGNLLEGQAIVWLRSPVEAFLAQVQGSVRVSLPDGSVLRLGYAGRNGHTYRSVGQVLIGMGEVAAEAMSAQAISDWCAANPARTDALLSENPSYVFFRVLDLAPGEGPLGAAGAGLTPLASLAVDPDIIPYGTPVWVETFGSGALRLLMVAQDTGSAIRGSGRGDVFFGSGPEAGERAGRMAEPGRMTPLFPRGHR